MYCQFLSKEVVPLFTAISNVQWCAFYHIKKKNLQKYRSRSGGTVIAASMLFPPTLNSLQSSLEQAGLSFVLLHFPDGSDSKESACNAGDPGSVPGLGRFPEEGNGNPLQYSCLENPMDGEAWQAPVHGVTKSRTGLNGSTLTCNSP